jgi:hypothetical protein
VIFGITAIVLFSGLGVTSLGPVRRWRGLGYRGFYATHVILAALVLVVAWMHVSHLRTYVYEAGGIYVLNILLRMFRTEKAVSVTVERVERTGLVKLCVPVLAGQGGKKGRGIAGQHAFLSLPTPASYKFLPNWSRWPWKQKNPFSIVPSMLLPSTAVLATSTASASTSQSASPNPPNPTGDGMTFFIRAPSDYNGAFTTTLSGLPSPSSSSSTSTPTSTATTTPQVIKNVVVDIETPYGSSPSYLSILLSPSTSSVLLVAGGVGATFALPIYSHLLQQKHGVGHKNNASTMVKLIWVVRTLEESRWGIGLLSGLPMAAGFKAVIYVTRLSNTGEGSETRDVSGSNIQIFLPSDGSGDGREKWKQGNRPNWRDVVAESFGDKSGGRRRRKGMRNVESELSGAGEVPEDDDMEQEGEGIEMEALMNDKSDSDLDLDGESEPDFEEPAATGSTTDSASKAARRRLTGRVKGRDKVAVLVCGPEGMSADVRREAGEYVARGREVWWWGEEFGV